MAHKKPGQIGKSEFGKDGENEDFGLEEEVPKWYNQVLMFPKNLSFFDHYIFLIQFI